MESAITDMQREDLPSPRAPIAAPCLPTRAAKLHYGPETVSMPAMAEALEDEEAKGIGQA